MTIPLLPRRIRRLLPILRNIPARLQVRPVLRPVLLVLVVQRVVHLLEDLCVRPALHGKHLALVVVALTNAREPLI